MPGQRTQEIAWPSPPSKGANTYEMLARIAKNPNANTQTVRNFLNRTEGTRQADLRPDETNQPAASGRGSGAARHPVGRDDPSEAHLRLDQDHQGFR